MTKRHGFGGDTSFIRCIAMTTAHGSCIYHQPVPIKSYRDLEAWQVGMDFAVRVYALTKQFPREEQYGLSSQLRRAATAIPSNIGEGHRHGTKAYIHFVTIALGSLAEAETQIELARRLRFAPASQIDTLNEMATSLARLLHGLRRSLEHHLVQSPNPNP